MNILDEKWNLIFKLNVKTSGKMYGMIKTHKNDNPVARIISSGCNTAVESLSLFV